MDINTIPDSLASDLREYFIKTPPLLFPEKSIRLQSETEELPLPRLVILSGEPKRIPKMDGTARLPISMEIVTSLDRANPADHKDLAGKLQTWWIALRALRGTASLKRCYLHDWLVMPPATTERSRGEDREQVTVLRAEAIATLYAEPQLI